MIAAIAWFGAAEVDTYVDEFTTPVSGDSFDTGTPDRGLSYVGSDNLDFYGDGNDVWPTTLWGDGGSFTITSRDGHDFEFVSLYIAPDLPQISPLTISGSGPESFTKTVDAGESGTFGPSTPQRVSQVTVSCAPPESMDFAFDKVTVNFLDFDPPELLSFERHVPETSPTSADTLVFRATFDEDVKNVTHGDFTVTGTTALLIGVTEISPTVYDLTVSGGDLAGYNGTVGIDLAAGQDIQDLADNALPDGEPAIDETYELDNAPPMDPTPSSSSHTVTVWDNDNTLEIQISGATDGGSGVDGFEVVWDKSDTWTPSAVKEHEETWNGATYTAITDGDWYFHIATVDNVGNWSDGTTLGPFRIDTTPPSIPTGLDPASGSHTNDMSPTLSWEASIDGGSGMRETNTYRIVVTGPKPKDDYVSDTDYNPSLSEGTFTWKLYARDNAGNASSYSADTTLIIDATQPDVTVEQAVGQADPTKDSPIMFTVTFDEEIRIGTFDGSDLVIGGTADTEDPAIGWLGMTSYSVTIPVTSDGTVTVSLPAGRVEDYAGNTNTASTSIDNEVTVDTTPPTNPALTCSSHTAGVWSNNDYINLHDYDTSSDAGSGVDGYETQWTTSPTWTPEQVKTMEEIVLDTGSSRPDGEWYYHIATVDNAGNWAAHDTYGPYRIDTIAPGVPSLSSPADGARVNTATPTLEWEEHGSEGSGYSATDCFNLEITGPETDIEYRLGATSAMPTLPDGTFTWHVSLRDIAGNESGWSPSRTLHVDTQPPRVTVEQAAEQADPTNLSPVVFTVTFNEEINIGSFDGSDVVIGGTAETEDPAIGWLGLTSYSLTIPVTSDGTVTVSIPAGGVEDYAGNTNTASTSIDNEVRVDWTLPLVTSVAPAAVSDADVGTVSVSITFNEPMDPVSPAWSPRIIGLTTSPYYITGNAWSNGNRTWTGSFTLIDDNETLNGTYYIADFQDPAGNYLALNTAWTLAVDTENPTLISVTSSETLITDADVGSTVSVSSVFDESLSTAGFLTDPTSALDRIASDWRILDLSTTHLPDDTMTVEFVVRDGDIDIPGVGWNVLGYDLAGNGAAKTIPDVLLVDTKNPVVTRVTVSDPLIEQDDAGSVFALTIDYSEAMDTATTPTVTFTPAVDSTLVLTGGTWVEDDVYRTRYEILDEEEKLLHVHVKIDGARDALGNAQIARSHSSAFGIDTITPPEGTVIVVPMGASGDETFLDRCLPLEEGEDPPLIAGQPLWAIYEIGEPITGDCMLNDRHGNADRNSYLIIELYRLDLGEGSLDQELLFSTQVRYAHDHGCYHFRIETTDLVPGTYDLRLVFKDGTSCRMRIQLVEPPAE